MTSLPAGDTIHHACIRGEASQLVKKRNFSYVAFAKSVSLMADTQRARRKCETWKSVNKGKLTFLNRLMSRAFETASENCFLFSPLLEEADWLWARACLKTLFSEG